MQKRSEFRSGDGGLVPWSETRASGATNGLGGFRVSLSQLIVADIPGIARKPAAELGKNLRPRRDREVLDHEIMYGSQKS